MLLRWLGCSGWTALGMPSRRPSPPCRGRSRPNGACARLADRIPSPAARCRDAAARWRLPPPAIQLRPAQPEGAAGKGAEANRSSGSTAATPQPSQGNGGVRSSLRRQELAEQAPRRASRGELEPARPVAERPVCTAYEDSPAMQGVFSKPLRHLWQTGCQWLLPAGAPTGILSLPQGAPRDLPGVCLMQHQTLAASGDC